MLSYAPYCEVCGQATSSGQGICTRTPGCQAARRRRSEGIPDPGECKVCRKPTRSGLGNCTRTPGCQAAWRLARDAEQHPEKAALRAEADQLEASGRRRCGQCRKIKALTAEYWPRDPHGPDGLRLVCKLCASEAIRASQVKARAWMREYKEGKSCLDCGCTFPSSVLQFHHRPGEKKVREVAKMASLRLIQAEIKKCDLICAVCHAVRHRGLEELPGLDDPANPCDVCTDLGQLEESGPGYEVTKRYSSKVLKLQAIRRHKSEPCTDCGKSFPWHAMCFYSRPGYVKTINISDISASWPRLIAEIAKRDLICVNCSAVRTYG